MTDRASQSRSRPRQRSRAPFAKALREAAIGTLQTAAWVAALVGFGAAVGSAWGPEARPATAVPQPMPALYNPPLPGPSLETPALERWLVDGFNVLHVAILTGRERGRWWQEDARTQLLERAAGFEEPDAELLVVFDGPRPAEAYEVEPGPRVVFAPSADEWVLSEVRHADDPGSVTVVTADRKLADRARHRGAKIVSPRRFLERCGA